VANRIRHKIGEGRGGREERRQGCDIEGGRVIQVGELENRIITDVQ